MAQIQGGSGSLSRGYALAPEIISPSMLEKTGLIRSQTPVNCDSSHHFCPKNLVVIQMIKVVLNASEMEANIYSSETILPD